MNKSLACLEILGHMTSSIPLKTFDIEYESDFHKHCVLVYKHSDLFFSDAQCEHIKFLGV